MLLSLDNLRKEMSKINEENYLKNDRAHREDHFEDVFECGMDMMQKTGKRIVTSKELLIAAYYHDLFAWDRDVHHLLSYQHVRTRNDELLKRILNQEEADRISMMCLEHRASFKGEFTNELTMFFNAADHGRPTTVESMIERATQLFSRELGISEGDAYKGAVLHLKDKYGYGGYARYPEVYLKVYADELKAIRDGISGGVTCRNFMKTLRNH